MTLVAERHRPAAQVHTLAAAVESAPGAVALGAALMAGVLLQGAYSRRGQVVVAALLLVAVLVTPRVHRIDKDDRPVVLAAAALGLWALAGASVHGDLRRGLPYVILLAAVVVAMRTACCGGAASRRLVRHAAVLAGLVVAGTAWWGVAGHDAGWGFHSAGEWRGSSTLTYPNAAAALLVVVTLVVLARATDPAHARPQAHHVVAATILLTGALATVSRAGVLALVCGLGVLGLGLGVRRLARAAAPPLVGAVVAAVGLVPSVVGAEAHPLLAAAALALGLAAAEGARRMPVRFVVATLAAVAAVAAIAAERLPHSRLTVADPERAGSFAAAFHVFAAHPLAGAGPGLSRLVRTTAGAHTTYRYAHNEYLQVLAELGLVGAVMLVALLAALLRRLVRSLPVSGAQGVGVLAAVVALLVHSGFDFLWHIPLVPILAAALVGSVSQGLTPWGTTATPIEGIRT